MSAELRRATNTQVWTEWEGQTVNGTYPLRRLLGGSNHSAVFLTEYKAEKLPDAAIKLVPADTLPTEAQLVQWGAAATLSHPHLTRLFDVGRCQIGGRAFLFVVMEYAEQTLAQILPRRALSPDEVREMLLPTLDVLAFLHRNQLVHGQLKPSNFLVINDQLKLASDTLRPTGNSPGNPAAASLYDPPELKTGGISSPAGDVWGLGVALIEALTQRAPAWPDERGETVASAISLPQPFADIVRQCLSRNPANRPTIAEIEAQFKPAAQAPVVAVSSPIEDETPSESATSQRPPGQRKSLPAVGIALLILLAVGVGYVFLGRTNPQQLNPNPSHVDLQPPASSGKLSRFLCPRMLSWSRNRQCLLRRR
jgi:serine/threonine protein kinase